MKIIYTFVVLASCKEPIFQKVYGFLKDGIVQIREDIFEDKPAVISPEISVDDYAGYGTTVTGSDLMLESRSHETKHNLNKRVAGESSLWE